MTSLASLGPYHQPTQPVCNSGANEKSFIDNFAENSGQLESLYLPSNFEIFLGHRRPEQSAFEQFAAAAAVAANHRDMQAVAAAAAARGGSSSDHIHDIRIQELGATPQGPRLLTPPEPILPGSSQGELPG
eukprot:sb/3475116/